MRIVFTAHPRHSHLAPLVLPAALRARQLGHEVAVATATAAIHHVERVGVTALPLARLPTLDAPGAVTPQLFAKAFAGTLGATSADELIPQLITWHADVVIREASEFGGYLAAEYLGIPYGTIDTSPLSPHDHRAVIDELNSQRRRLGLEPTDDPWHPAGRFHAGVVPDAFYPREHRPPTTRHYRAPVPYRDVLDPDIADLPADRPLVLASLGPSTPRLLDVLLDALADLPVTAVVIAGGEADVTTRRGPRPGNVRLVRTPQPALLTASDLFVTHAGFTGTRQALAAGVPMVALPLRAEQPANADRIVQLGLGVALDGQDASAPALRHAVREVLTRPTYRGRARWFQRQTLALPHWDQLVPDLVDALATRP